MADLIPQPEAVPGIQIPLRDGTVATISFLRLAELQDCFPGLDVEAELRKCAMWNRINPSRRKTARGIDRHLFTWLSKAHGKKRKRSAVDTVDAATAKR